MDQPPDIGDATLKQTQSQIADAIGKIGFAAVAKIIVGVASPDECALLAGMAARGRAAATAAESPLAAALKDMSLMERRAALKTHYAAALKGNTWTDAKSAKPTPQEFLAWLDAVFPDRREIGLVLSDLRHLDPPARKKIFNWSLAGSGVSKDAIKSFGVPSKVTRYDPVRDAGAPSSRAEVYARAERGEDSVRNLHRAYSRARYHANVP